MKKTTQTHRREIKLLDIRPEWVVFLLAAIVFISVLIYNRFDLTATQGVLTLLITAVISFAVFYLAIIRLYAKLTAAVDYGKETLTLSSKKKKRTFTLKDLAKVASTQIFPSRKSIFPKYNISLSFDKASGTRDKTISVALTKKNALMLRDLISMKG